MKTMNRLRHVRWFRFSLMQKRVPFVGLAAHFYISRTMKMIGWKHSMRALYRIEKKRHVGLSAQLNARRKPRWVPRDPRMVD